MLYLFLILTLSTSAAFSAPYDPSNCATNKQQYSCPTGTQYMECTTRTTIGASTAEVRALTDNFFNIDWMGLPIDSHVGANHVPGATRNLTIPTMMGVYKFQEELLQHDTQDDGSYTVRFMQKNIPVPYTDGKGQFAGFWVTRKAMYAGRYQTNMEWNVYACLTGQVGFPKFHRMALNNATAVLQVQGKILGVSIPPHSDCNYDESSEKVYEAGREKQSGSKELRIQIEI